MTDAFRPFAGLLDDAAVFPPGDLPLAEAVPAHYGHRRSGYAELVGPLVLPAAALAGLAPLLDGLRLDGSWPGGSRLAVSVTAPGHPGDLAAITAGAAALDGVVLAAVEVTLPAETRIKELLGTLDDVLPGDVAGYVEVPRDERRPGVLDALAGSRYRAKFRTGGVVPAAHPDEQELAGALAGAAGRGLAFKCTAGLHHAVRHTDGDLEQHGFLNVLLATEAAVRGAGAGELAVLLAQRDAAAVAAQVAGLPPDRLAAARSSFRSFGTCSVTDPLRDLIALGLLPGPVVA
jgi:hypothetical protein